MKAMCALAAGAVACVAGTAMAQPYVVGQFQGWSNPGQQMTLQSPGVWKTTVSGMGANAVNSFKVNMGNWNAGNYWPANSGDMRGVADGSGMLDVWFYDNPAPNDGWWPNSQRVGMSAQGAVSYEIMGAFNGWSSPVTSLTDQGNGIYTGGVFANAGSYDFKFRKAGDWAVNMGQEFGDNSNNLNAVVANNGDWVAFTLDTKGGRLKFEVVPTPGAMALLGLGGLIIGRRRR